MIVLLINARWSKGLECVSYGDGKTRWEEDRRREEKLIIVISDMLCFRYYTGFKDYTYSSYGLIYDRKL